MRPKALLDSDTLSAIMKKHAIATARAKTYLFAQHRLTFSIITRYEILRGLKAKHATTQLAQFEQLCQVSEILPLNDAMIVRAADVYADLKQRGTLIHDADILIAATAMIQGFALVTNNEAHFSRISGLQIENWINATATQG